MSVGMLGYLGIGVESSAGAASHSISAADFAGFISETLSLNRAEIESQQVTHKWDVDKIYDGVDAIGGNVTLEVHPATVGYFLRSFFDTTTVAVGSGAAENWMNAANSHANVYIHRFIAGQGQFQAGSGSDVPTLSLEVYRGPTISSDSSFAYHQLACNQMELSIDGGGLMRGSFDFLGRGESRVAFQSPTFPVPDTWLWSQASLSFDGAGDSTFENLTIRGTNNLEQVNVIDGTSTPGQTKRNDFRRFEVTGQQTFRDNTQYENFRQGSEAPMKVTFTGTEIDSGHNTKFIIDGPAYRQLGNAPQVGGPGRISVPINARFAYHSGSGTALEILVVNSRANSFDVNSSA